MIEDYSEEDLRAAKELERIIDGKEYAVISREPRGVQMAVVIPYGRLGGTRRFKILWRALRLFYRVAWKVAME